MKNYARCIAFFTFAIIAVVAVYFIGTPALSAISLLAVGIVIGGKEIGEVDQINSIETLYDHWNQCNDELDELRDKYHARADKEKNQPGSWEDNEEKRYNEVNGYYDDIKGRIEKLKSQQQLEKDFEKRSEERKRLEKERPGITGDGAPGTAGDPQVTEETRALALQGWLALQGGQNISKRHQDAMDATGLVPFNPQLRFNLFNGETIKEMRSAGDGYHLSLRKSKYQAFANNMDETRALGVGSAGSGQEWVPTGFIANVEVNMLAYGSVMQAADIFRTASGETLPWPTFNDTSNKGRMIAEAAASNTNVDPTSGNVLFNAYKSTSDAILVSYEALQDEGLAPRLPMILAAAIGERLGRICEEKLTTGTGSSEPQGIVTAAGVGVTTAGLSFDADDIIALEHSVDPAYRSMAAFMMHDSIVQSVRILKDSEGNYLWRSGLREGTPDTLLGRMLYVNQEMATAFATTNRLMLFGDLSQYKVREVGEVRSYRLQERYRVESDQDAFVAFKRFDGKLLNAGTNPIKALVMP